MFTLHNFSIVTKGIIPNPVLKPAQYPPIADTTAAAMWTTGLSSTGALRIELRTLCLVLFFFSSTRVLKSPKM